MSTFDNYDSSSDGLRRVRTWLWIAGIAAIALGAIGILFPFVVTLAAELLFGGLLATLGLLQIIRTIVNGSVESRVWALLFGAISLAVGVLLLLYPLGGMLTLTIVLASFFVAGGVAKMVGAWQMRRQRTGVFSQVRGWGWLMLSGALSLVLGAILFLGLPTTATWALGLLLGVDLLFLGISQIALAIGLSQLTTA